MFWRSVYTFCFVASVVFMAGATDQKPENKSENKSEKKSENKFEKNEWSKKMGELLQALTAITPDLYSNSASQTVTPEFRERVKKIAELSRALDQNDKHAMKAPDDDPGLAYLSRMFREDMERAAQSLDSGSTDYAKTVLKSSVSYCIACHTRSQSGPQFPLMAALEKPLENASWVEKISFRAATRQFGDVITDVMSKLEPGAIPAIKGFELEKAIRIALTVAVRVKNDPARALLLSRKVAESSVASDQLRERARTWIKDIGAWQDEKQKVLASDRDLMNAAHQILGRLANDASVEDLRRDGSEIKSLRATTLMHRLLREFPKSPLVAEALFLVGASYEALGDLGFWNLSDMYFKSCIQHAPHTARAEVCYRRFEENVVLGFTGSGGTHLPHAIDAHLKQIKSLAWRNEGNKPQ